jgi:type VII secretion effector (TIGR04197 family)
MKGTITIDSTEVDNKIQELKTLRDDPTLTNSFNKLITTKLTSSKGDVATKVNEIDDRLEQVKKQIDDIIAKSIEFLTNAKTSFEALDEGLAKEFKQ